MKNNNDNTERLDAIYTLQLSILLRCLHDVQSPLSAVSGYLELLQICTSSDQSIEKIDRYGKQLSKGIDEISHIIQLIRSSHNISPEGFSGKENGEIIINKLLNDIYDDVRDYAIFKEKSILFTPGDNEFTLLTDPLLLRLALYNLLMLVIKFSGKNETISLKAEADQNYNKISISSQKIEKPAHEILNNFNLEKTLKNPALITEKCLQGKYIFGIEYIKYLNGTLAAESSSDNAICFNILF